jgi:hypothetical protein
MLGLPLARRDDVHFGSACGAFGARAFARPDPDPFDRPRVSSA